MKKYSLLLLPLLAGIVLVGCEDACCLDDTVNDPQPKTQHPPVAKILLNGVEIGAAAECTPGEAITLTPASTDSDGSVIDNIWKIDGAEVSNATIVCPDDKQKKTVCLSAMDNDGLYSKEQKCVTFTAKATPVTPPQPTTTPPLSIVEKGELTGADGIFFDCSKVKDTDTIHTYPNDTYLYGSNTPKDIKEVTWNYTYYKADGTIEDGPNTKTQSDYNAAGGHAPGTCKKWFHLDNGVAKIEFSVTTIDDDQESNTTNYSYDAASGTLTQK